MQHCKKSPPQACSMPLSEQEFQDILNDTSKRIIEDIEWVQKPNHASMQYFTKPILSDGGYPLVLHGSYNPSILKLNYQIICNPFGRIYGLDLGRDHKNPSGEKVGEKHKHRWDEALRDKDAYIPDDITSPPSKPLEVWEQFCLEAAIIHEGIMKPPPPQQLDFLL